MAYIWHRIVNCIPVGCTCYLFFMTASIVTLMSVERWLHMTRRSLVTTRRVCYIVSLLLVLPLPFVVCYVQGTYIHDDSVTVASISLVLFSLSVTSLVFFKVFRIIRRHQQQISQANESSHNFGQPSINLAKYKKSMLSIIYILAVFYMGYAPAVITAGVFLYLPRTYLNSKFSASKVTIVHFCRLHLILFSIYGE